MLVDKGRGFSQTDSGQKLAPGSRIVLRKGSRATLSYDDDCTVRLAAGTIYTVAAVAPCNRSQRRVDFTGRMGNQHEYDVVSRRLPWGGIIISSALAGAAIYEITQNGNKPSSP